MISRLPAQERLPTLSDLGDKFALHPSTIFRMLRDLTEEGCVWQSPQGKFYAAAAQRKTLRGAPVCFIGREMWQWGRLYQEILKGIAEVCGANGSPLILLSSQNLVRQANPSSTPKFASLNVTKDELRNLLTASPTGCAGCVFDHLWQASAIDSVKHPGGKWVQLLAGIGQHAEVVAPDYQTGNKARSGVPPVPETIENWPCRSFRGGSGHRLGRKLAASDSCGVCGDRYFVFKTQPPNAE